MTLNFRSVRSLAFAAFGLLPLKAVAQTPGQPDIVGLTLGMTIADAQATLKKYNPSLKFLPLYVTASTDQDAAGYLAPYSEVNLSLIQVPTGIPPKVKVQVELVASSITHVYGNSNYGDPGEITGNDNEPVFETSGEWFRLDFTPTDNGGRLYAIVHATAYPQGVTLSPDTVQGQLASKYGPPPYAAPGANPTDQSSVAWIYDRRGRLLSTNNAEFSRCFFIPADNASNSVGLSGGMYGLSTPMKVYENAFSGSPPASFSFSEKVDMDAAAGEIESFVPDFAYVTSNIGARSCGVQLQAQFQSIESGYPSYLVVTLSDQNAAFYDNGIAAYVAKKLTEVNGPAVSAPAPNL
jgi:hypothetical protein